MNAAIVLVCSFAFWLIVLKFGKCCNNVSSPYVFPSIISISSMVLMDTWTAGSCTCYNIRKLKFHQVARISSTRARARARARPSTSTRDGASTSTRDRASTSARDRASASARHRVLLYHRISLSFDLPPATTSVSHLTCPLPPHH